MLEAALEYAKNNHARSFQSLKDFLAIPSISTLPENAGDIARAARWLADELRGLGMGRVDILPTAGHPVVYAERLESPGAPTILVYGHYDVQPADPIEEWRSDPFAPTVQGEDLFARGASDMKGALVAFFGAVEALQQAGGVPVNLKFLIEGEEEVGSPHLGDFLEQHRELLACDVAINCDGDVYAPDQPSICYALRGLAYFEIEVRGPKQDLHSGTFGGSIHNPAQALCELIAGMHDAQGRVTLPGFYERVRPLTTEERDTLGRIPHSDPQWLGLTGAPGLWGEAGYSTLERIGARPTLEVNGLVGGFTGTGSKTVLPAKAVAKVSMRLVADQDPAEVREQLCAYLLQHAPATVTWELREHAHAPGALMDRNSPYMRAAAGALRDTFGKEPLFTREGGSVPVVGLMQQILGVDSVMLGTRLPDSGMHGPNEKQHLPTFYRMIEVFIRLMCAVK